MNIDDADRPLLDWLTGGEPQPPESGAAAPDPAEGGPDAGGDAGSVGDTSETPGLVPGVRQRRKRPWRTTGPTFPVETRALPGASASARCRAAEIAREWGVDPSKVRATGHGFEFDL